MANASCETSFELMTDSTTYSTIGKQQVTIGSNEEVQRKSRMIVAIALALHAISFAMLFPIYPHFILKFTGGDTARAAEISGWLASLGASLKLFMNPVFGTLSDAMGRKGFLIFGLGGHVVAWCLMGTSPTLNMLLATNIIIGLTDSVFVIAFSIFADLTGAGMHGNQVSSPSATTKSFGLAGVAFGIGLIYGPVIGGYIGEKHETLPFFIASALSLIAAALVTLRLKESHENVSGKIQDPWQATPWPACRLLYQNPKVLLLALPHFLLHFASGIHTIWFLYTNYRFGWDEYRNGLYLSFIGLWIALSQGVFLGFLVPKYMTEWHAVMMGFILKAIASLIAAVATTGTALYAMAAISALGGIAFPSILALSTEYVKPEDQGTLQGAMGSITTLAIILSGPTYAEIFHSAVSDSQKQLHPLVCPNGYNVTHLKHQTILTDNCGGNPSLPFLVDSLQLLLGFLLTVLIYLYLQRNSVNIKTLPSDSQVTDQRAPILEDDDASHDEACI